MTYVIAESNSRKSKEECPVGAALEIAVIVDARTIEIMIGKEPKMVQDLELNVGTFRVEITVSSHNEYIIDS